MCSSDLEGEGGFAGADEEELVLGDVGDFEVGQAALASKVCVRLRAFACKHIYLPKPYTFIQKKIHLHLYKKIHL